MREALEGVSRGTQARDHNALIGLDPVPDAVREVAHRRAPGLAGAGNDLILERVLSDTSEGAADLCCEPIAEPRFPRFVIVLRAGDIGLS